MDRYNRQIYTRDLPGGVKAPQLTYRRDEASYTPSAIISVEYHNNIIIVLISTSTIRVIHFFSQY